MEIAYLGFDVYSQWCWLLVIGKRGANYPLQNTKISIGQSDITQALQVKNGVLIL